RGAGRGVRCIRRTLALVLIGALLLAQLPNHTVFLARAGAPLLPATADSPSVTVPASAPAGQASLADGPASPVPLVLTPSVSTPFPAGQAALPDGPDARNAGPSPLALTPAPPTPLVLTPSTPATTPTIHAGPIHRPGNPHATPT